MTPLGHRRARRITGVILTALALAGCGHSRSVTTTSATNDAPHIVATAATMLARTPAYTMHFTSATSANGQTSTESGSFDFTTHEATQRIVTAGGNTPAVQNGRPLNAVAIGKLLYLNLPSQQRRDLSIPRPWVSFTARQYNQSLGANGGLESISEPFHYGAYGLRLQLSQFLFNGAASFTADGTGSVDGVETRRYIGHTGPITVQETTHAHRTITETFKVLALTVWIDGNGRVREIEAHSEAKDESTITDRFVVTAFSAAAAKAPARANVINYASLVTG